MKIAAWMVLGLGLVGCGANKAYETSPRYGGSTDGPSAPEPAAKAPQFAEAASSYDRAESAARAPSGAPMPQSRPGLGTEWGETRESRIYETSFTRASSSPFAIVSLYYNDQRGIDALSHFHERRHSRTLVDNSWVSVNLRDDGNRPFDAFQFGDRNYVVGQAGERYSIVLTNRTAHRIEAVTTVDGLDVINGGNGSTRNREYILMPYATIEIDGFRKNENEVAAFRFGAVEDSYAAERGKPRNIGVIGVALFDEQHDRIDPREIQMRDTANPFPSGGNGRFAPPPPPRY